MTGFCDACRHAALGRRAWRHALVAAVTLFAVEAIAAPAADGRVPVPRPRPATAPKAVKATTTKATITAAPAAIPVTASMAPMMIAPPTFTPAMLALAPAVIPATTGAITTRNPLLAAPLAMAATSATPQAEIALVKQAIAMAKAGRASDATALGKTINDPLARKLVEWTILRSDGHDAGFDRFAAFIAANPGWPAMMTLRRRAENALWEEKRDAATVRAFFASVGPLSAKGRFALARALLAHGDRTKAAHYAREAWRGDNCSADLEKQVIETFGDLLTRADHKARMDTRLYAEDTEVAARAAHRLGGEELAIVKARKAVIDKASNAGALLEAVPAASRHDAGYIFSRVQWLRRNDKIAEAGRLLLGAPRDPAQLHNLDEWWIERRLVARKLLDLGETETAYKIVRDAASPPKENFRAEHEFTAGWIALRFLNNPGVAMQHFARVGAGTAHPTTLARADYWQGRAAEAAGRTAEARAHYEAAARFPTAYYGQIARARLGVGDIALRRAPEPANRAASMNLEVVRAAEILYTIGERDLVAGFVADLAERAQDIGALVVLAELAQKHDDARAVLLIGKGALARGFAFDVHAFPTSGVPSYSPIGPPAERSIVYAIARQESAFNPRVVSSAKALGLMQVTPGAGRDIAKRFGVAFDQKRLLSDTVYNAQMGSAELGGVLQDYRGSFILAFAAYNAGRGRVKEWVGRYGDPRDPKVDPIDWVERIPFSETRNYVQRIIENVQVYRVRLGQGSKLLIEADLHRGAAAN